MSGAIAVLERHLEEGYRITAVVVDEQTPVSLWGRAELDRSGTLLELRDHVEVELLDAQDYDFALKRVRVPGT
jgi:hypothetical protein